MAKFHLFRSEKYPGRAIKIGERDDGTYYIPEVEVEPEANIFYSIEEIEKVLDDSLELLRPTNELN